MIEGSWNGLVCTNVDPAFRSDPTQSACCDESQLLLGFPPHERGVHQSRITHGTTFFPVSGSLVPPFAGIGWMLFF